MSNTKLVPHFHSKVGKRKRRRYGAVAVEMALVAPVIFLLFFGSIEFARMMMVRQALTNAAREGCRTACLATTQSSNSCDAAIRDALDAVIRDASATGPLEITIQPAFQSTPDTGTTITATVAVDCSAVSWLPPFFTAGAKISANASTIRE